MTEQVQPLTLQKTTNLEEHNQFFNKINEIIDNLAPTVEEAEAATASAEQAIADAETAIGNANTAISTANTAVSTANAASARAQAAADTVAGFDARLTDVEDTAVRTRSTEVQVIDSDVQVVNGHDLAVAGDVDVAGDVNAAGAEIAGLALEKSGTKTVLSNEAGITFTGTTAISVADTATGIRTAAAVNGKRLQNDLDAYALMIRSTGAQVKNGILTLNDGYIGFPNNWHSTHVSTMIQGQYCIFARILPSAQSVGRYTMLRFVQSSNTAVAYGEMLFKLNPLGPDAIWITRKAKGSNSPLAATDVVILVDADNNINLAWKKSPPYGAVACSEAFNVNYGGMIRVPNSPVTWLSDEEKVVLDTLDGYTVHEVTE